VKGDKKFQKVLETALSLQSHLQEGKPISMYPDKDQEAFVALNQEMRFLTGKPVIFAANVDEEGLSEEDEIVAEVRRIAADLSAEVVVLCGRLEEELSDMLEDEQRELLKVAGVSESGLSQVIRKSYAALSLISYFTKNENEVRAWTIPVETTASKAAGVIHTDFERGFIRAEVIPFDEYGQYGSDSAAKAAGAIRLEGKNYIVQDGDIILFRFNV
jgi:ribosome-binding ATPase YchF (GTP1/OBG family)